ncbi:MAG: hypothetical protein BECKG1743E_GA0114224_104351 [Candidatus Kentron sp. G]|nr:MAG: hypothetical protein BECKG1743E_GA0114224_104351 [Candidatus Kentron sp. G]
MTEKKKRKVHSPEYKAKVGLEALKGVKTINEIGQEYGVHPVQVGQWKKAIQEDAKSLFEVKKPFGNSHRSATSKTRISKQFLTILSKRPVGAFPIKSIISCGAPYSASLPE